MKSLNLPSNSQIKRILVVDTAREILAVANGDLSFLDRHGKR